MDEFKMIRLLGGGGGGIASLVKSLNDNKEYVLKTISLSPRKAFVAEMQMGEYPKVDSPYLVKYYDFYADEYNGTFNIVMEYCPGGDLLKLILSFYKNNYAPIPYPIIKKIIAESVIGLFVLHRAHIMHSNIKPENIFVTEDYNVKIGDFGTGKHLESTVAEAATLIGTKEYEAPEVLAGQPYSFTADIYSLGLVFYQVLARFPKGFGIKSITREDIPQGLKSLVTAMHSEDPTKRPTIKDIVQDPVVKEAILELPWDSLPELLLADYGLDVSQDPKTGGGAGAAAATATSTSTTAATATTATSSGSGADNAAAAEAAATTAAEAEATDQAQAQAPAQVAGLKGISPDV